MSPLVEFPAMLAAFAMLGALVHAAGVAAGRRARFRPLSRRRMNSRRRISRLSERVEALELGRFDLASVKTEPPPTPPDEVRHAAPGDSIIIPGPLVHYMPEGAHVCAVWDDGDIIHQSKADPLPEGYEPCPRCYPNATATNGQPV